LLWGELVEVLVEARPLPLIGDVLDGAVVEIGDDCQVAVPLCGALLVDADPANGLLLLATMPARDRLLHDVPRLVPGDAQDARSAGYVRFLEDVDHQSLEQSREPGLGLGPGNANLVNTVLGALHPWDAGVQVGHELAAIQVPPAPLRSVVVQGERLAALGARPDGVPMLRPDIDPLLLDLELYVGHRPWGLEPQEVAVQLGIPHAAPPTARWSLRGLEHLVRPLPGDPRQTRENLKKIADGVP
jgi:hypothetical protein